MLARLKLGMFDPRSASATRRRLTARTTRRSTTAGRRWPRSRWSCSRTTGLAAASGPGHGCGGGAERDALITLLGNYYGVPSTRSRSSTGYAPRSRRHSGHLRPRRGPGRGPDRPTRRSRDRTRPPAAGGGRLGARSRGGVLQGTRPGGHPILRRLDPAVDFRWFRGAPTDEPVARESCPPSAPSRRRLLRSLDREAAAAVSGEHELVVTPTTACACGRPATAHRCLDQRRTDPRSSCQVSLLAARLTTSGSSTSRASGRRGAAGLDAADAKDPFEEALDAARAADVVVFVGGLTADVEGEEMPVSFPGFRGGDRTDIELPAVQARMLEALHATGKPVSWC